MPVRESHAPGMPSWIDLASRDMESAKAFYGALFGWDFFEAPEPEAGGYTMAMLKGKAAAAMMPQQQEQVDMGIPPHWNMYITVDDIDATAAAVEAAGGSVMAPPFDVLTAGRMMVAVDAGGAVVCFWEPRDAIGSEIVNESGAFTWAELYSNDHDASSGFYEKLLGLTSEPMDMGGPPMRVLKLDGQDIATMLPVMSQGVPSHWLPYFGVDDCDATVARISELGGQIYMDPMDIPPGRFSCVADPEGAAFAVIALADPPTA